jgi:two-component system sensor histidine kinase/response regulator
MQERPTRHKQAEGPLQEGQAQTEALYQISRRLNAARNEQELLQVLSRPAAEGGALGAALMYIDLNDSGEPEWLELVATWGHTGVEPPAPDGSRFHLAESPGSLLWLDKPNEAQLIADVDRDARVDESGRQMYAQIGVRATAVIPLNSGGHWVGVLFFTWAEPHVFSPQETAIYHALTGLATGAVESRRFLVERERAITSTLYAISQALNTAQSANEILQAILPSVIEAGASVAALLYVESGKAGAPRWCDVVSSWHASEAPVFPVGQRFALEESPFFQALMKDPRVPRPILVSDVAVDSRLDGHASQVYEQAGVRAHVTIPLVQAGHWIGVLVFGWPAPHRFDEREIAIYKALPALVGPLVENRRLVENLEQAVKERTAELQESQQVLASILDNIPLRVFWKDRDLNYLGCNRAFAGDFRLDSCDQIIGRNDFEVGFPGHAERYRRDDRQVLASGMPKLNYVEPQTRPDGSQAWVETSKVPLRDETGAVWGVLGVYDDITERVQAEEALKLAHDELEHRVQERTAELQAQYARLDAILHNSADGIVVADRAGSIIQTNRVAQEWLTRTLSPADAGRLRQAIQILAQQAGTAPELVLELAALDLELTAAPVLENRAQEPAAAVVSIHDVSHLKAIDRMRTTFITNISHELRTPITTVQAYAYLIQKTSPEDEKWNQYMQIMLQEVDRQVQLVKDILCISRIYAGRLEIVPRPTSLNDLTEAAVAAHQSLAQKRDLVVVHRPADPAPVLPVDPQQMMMVLNNLLGDAIRYTQAGGQVVVSTGQAEAEGRVWATVAVSDTGERIPAEDLLHIFERFFREEEPRSARVFDTGLRLMILREIVALHDGRVMVESGEREGTTFTVWLPLADQPNGVGV